MCSPISLFSHLHTHLSSSAHPSPHIFKTVIWNYLWFLKIQQTASGFQIFAHIVLSSRKTLSLSLRHLRLTHSSKCSSSITSSKKSFLSFLIQYRCRSSGSSHSLATSVSALTPYTEIGVGLSLPSLCVILSYSSLLGLSTKWNMAECFLNEWMN